MLAAAHPRRRRWLDAAFLLLGAALIVLSLGTLAALLLDLLRDGLSRLSLEFLTSFPSRKPDQAGVKSAIVGTCAVMFVTAVTALPLGVASGIYLEEYARKNWRTAIIEINIANLAGVPSIIWGLMALGLLVYALGLKRSILTAGLTLGLLVLPIVIVATREAIRAIPQGIREGAYALGASRWQTVRHHVLPYSMSGILTGAIIAMSRAIGETAPLIMVGAFQYIPFAPDGVFSRFTVMPVQIFTWSARPQAAFRETAAAGIIVLLALLLTLNSVAIYLRNRYQRKVKW